MHLKILQFFFLKKNSKTIRKIKWTYWSHGDNETWEKD